MHDFDNTVRSSPYLQEFQEIFKGHRLHFGVPEDIFRLVEQMNESVVLREEISATMRSIIYRENGAIPSPQMVKMLGVAIGGPYFDERAPEIQESYRTLEGFMVEVVRSFRRSLREGKPLSEAEAVPEEARGGEVVDQGPSDTTPGRARQEVYAEEDVAAPQETEAVYARRELASGGMYSEARRMSSQFDDSKAASASEPGVREHAGEPFYVVADTKREEVFVPATRRSAYWFPAISALLVIVGFGLVWRHRSRTGPAARPEQTAAQSTVAGGISAGSPRTGVTGPDAVIGATGSTQQVPAGRSGGQGSATASLPSSAGGMSAGISTPGQTGLPVVVQGEGTGEPEVGAARVVRGDQGGAANGTQVIPVPAAETPRVPAARPMRPAGQVGGAVAAPVSRSKDGFLVSSGVMGRNLLSKPVMPPYPKMAAMWGIEGRVILQAVISSNGQVLSTNVLQGHHMLRGAAQNAVSKWVYRPRVVGGKPVDAATIVIVDFKMRH